MKLNLINTQNESREGYMDMYISQMEMLDFYVSNGECEEIIANDILDHTEYAKRGEVLSLLVSKLQVKQGKILIGGFDYRGVCKFAVNGQSDGPQVNQLLFGSAPNLKKSIAHIEEVTTVLKANGCNVTHITYAGFQYTISAERVA